MEIISEKEVNDCWKIVRERYAQVGVWVDWEIYPPVAQPAGVDLKNGLTVEEKGILGGVPQILHQEARALIKGVGTEGEVNAYYVNTIIRLGEEESQGFAVTKNYFVDIDDHKDYFYNFFIAVEPEGGRVEPGFVEAHELGHCVGELLHPPERFWMMFGAASRTNAPTSAKRFSESEEAKIHADPHAK
jgi:hypothetical protein